VKFDMAVTLGNALLLAGSILAAVCALFWPNIEQAYVAYNTPRGSNTQGAKGKCPLVRSLGFSAAV